MLLLTKKLTGTLIEQTKTKPQETLKFKMTKQMETSSFNPPILLVEEGKWVLAVTSFEATNYVFNITYENNTFSFTTLGHWSSRGGAETIYKVQKFLELRSGNDIDLHVKKSQKERIRY